jgi:hypothetical protein
VISAEAKFPLNSTRGGWTCNGRSLDDAGAVNFDRWLRNGVRFDTRVAAGVDAATVRSIDPCVRCARVLTADAGVVVATPTAGASTLGVTALSDGIGWVPVA